MVIKEPLSQYSRKIWILYEWLMRQVLNIPDLKEGNYVPLIDEKLQYAISKGINSNRHRILNNLPGIRISNYVFELFNKIDVYIGCQILNSFINCYFLKDRITTSRHI